MPVGDRADALNRALLGAGLRPAAAPPRPRLSDLPDALRDDVLDLYRHLGGVQPAPSLQPGKWDLAFDGLVVELDEQFHFNRYRATTLAAPWEPGLPWASAYRVYCAEHERECLARARVGGRWTNPSCERMFGMAGAPGDLAGDGPPRWKQRALYDAMKDLTPQLGFGVRLARISIYDVIDGVAVDAILSGAASHEPEALRAFVESRTA